MSVSIKRQHLENTHVELRVARESLAGLRTRTHLAV